VCVCVCEELKKARKMKWEGFECYEVGGSLAVGADNTNMLGVVVSNRWHI
jgi:hypothetical protein